MKKGRGFFNPTSLFSLTNKEGNEVIKFIRKRNDVGKDKMGHFFPKMLIRSNLIGKLRAIQNHFLFEENKVLD